MTDVLIRDVPPEDLDRIRAAASDAGSSLQAYLREAVRTRAAHLRRVDAVARTAERLKGGQQVPEQERTAVLEAIDRADDERAQELGSGLR